MKLLFDHNLSYKLVARLADLFPDSEHVRNVNLHEADDRTVWEYARANGFAIVSKDEDFQQLSFLYGHRLKWYLTVRSNFEGFRELWEGLGRQGGPRWPRP
jgi:predicted nuclease of predicted toxin-antitoxin system